MPQDDAATHHASPIYLGIRRRGVFLRGGRYDPPDGLGPPRFVARPRVACLAPTAEVAARFSAALATEGALHFDVHIAVAATATAAAPSSARAAAAPAPAPAPDAESDPLSSPPTAMAAAEPVTPPAATSSAVPGTDSTAAAAALPVSAPVSSVSPFAALLREPFDVVVAAPALDAAHIPPGAVIAKPAAAAAAIRAALSRLKEEEGG